MSHSHQSLLFAFENTVTFHQLPDDDRWKLFGDYLRRNVETMNYGLSITLAEKGVRMIQDFVFQVTLYDPKNGCFDARSRASVTGDARHTLNEGLTTSNVTQFAHLGSYTGTCQIVTNWNGI
jgi:hypothetical protein